MDTIALHFSTTTAPELGAFRFYVEAGRRFDADAYAETFKLNRPELSARDVHAAQDEAARLNPGEWLLVEHELDNSAGQNMRPQDIGFAHDGMWIENPTVAPCSSRPISPRRYGFRVENMSGGCTAWWKDLSRDRYLLLSDCDGSHEYRRGDVLVLGLYDNTTEGVEPLGWKYLTAGTLVPPTL